MDEDWLIQTTESRPLNPLTHHSIRTSVVAGVVAVASFKLAFTVSWLSLPAIVVYAMAMVVITRARTSRTAFYMGLAVGFSLAAIELTFFMKIFGPGAMGLWLILGLWTALFAATAQMWQTRRPGQSILWLPVLWMGFEYFRSELYYLRFSWVTPGLALTESVFEPLLSVGQFGAGALIVLLAGLLLRIVPRSTALGVEVAVRLQRRAINASFLTAGLWVAVAVGRGAFAEYEVAKGGDQFCGIQLEFPSEPMLLETLDDALQKHPAVHLFVLSEYTFDGPVPDAVIAWCRDNDRYLVAGGKQLEGNTFRNTAFVVDPDGEIVHKQVKAVPIQLMRDGLPATEQLLWDSPWGKIGFAICYDMSYTRVIDKLIADGAEIIINPTMDPVDWGPYEHDVHARIPICRAREYAVPVFRVASSGVSVAVPSGNRIRKGEFPGQGHFVLFDVATARNAARPIDRIPALVSVALTAVIMLMCFLRLPRRSVSVTT